jgi:eukaryotic-like serine/threonine-protein kinase
VEVAPFVSSFGKYRLIASLARGGMARVYLAVMAGPAGFHKLLVLKVMRGGALGDTPDGVRMFMNEARLAARIMHPNVVHTYEVGEVDGRPFLAMEYVEGQTYRTLQTRAGERGLPLVEELRVLAELARGLHCLHELKNYDGSPLAAVHRDVSPQNVLVGHDGQVRLVDFGIARTADPAHWTQTGVIKGKIDYIAPEQLRGESVDRRADVFALGVMLWEALAAQRFAGGATRSEVVKAQARLSGREPKIRELKPDVPEELAALLDRALAVDPAARLADAASFAEVLDGYLARQPKRPTAATLSALMGELFAEDREKLRKLVEQQIASIKQSGFDAIASDQTGILPRLELTGSSIWALPPSEPNRAQPARANTDRPATYEARHKLRPRSWAVLAIAVVTAALAAWFVPSERDAPTARVATQSSEPPNVAASPGRSEPEVVTRVAEPTARAPSEPEPSAAEPKVTLAFSVQPVHARVTIDGVVVAMPFTAELARDGSLHDVRASAPGFAPFRQLVGFDRDRTLDIVLTRPAVKRPQPPPNKGPFTLGIDTRDPYTVKKK